MKKQILRIVTGILATSSVAIASPPTGFMAYQCGNWPRSSSADPDFTLAATFDFETKTGLIHAVVNGEKISEAVQVGFVFHSTIGRSRCPGTWTEIQFTSESSEGLFKKLSIMTNQYFYGCGFPPGNSVVFNLGEKDQEIKAFCENSNASDS